MTRAKIRLNRHPQERLLLQRLSWMGSIATLGSFVLVQASIAAAVQEFTVLERSPAPPEAPSSNVPAAPPVSIISQPETLSPVPSLQPLEPTAPIPSISTNSRPLVGNDRQPATDSATESTSAALGEPLSVILSERSTGCQSEVQLGREVSWGPCGAPKPVVVPSPIVAIETTSSAIETTSSAAAVQMGPLSVGYDGIGLGTTTTARDYYNRSLRPVGRLGNGNISLIFPLALPAPISSAFGWRIHPITGDRRLHSGTDLAAPSGTPVLAAYAGEVTIADFLGGYGLAIALSHNKNTQQTLYAHLSEVFVKPGEQVKQGDVIGRVGSTGNSTGPHLHFEFRQQTPEGWVAMDAGAQLEYSLAQLVKALEQTAQNPTQRS